MVYWHQVIQKQPGKLRGMPQHDQENQSAYYDHRYPFDVSWLCYDGAGTDRTYGSRRSMGVPYYIFHIWNQNLTGSVDDFQREIYSLASKPGSQ